MNGKKFKLLGLIGALGLCISFTLAVLIWGAIVYGVAAIGVSSVKAASGDCSSRMKIESIVRHGSLFCPEPSLPTEPNK
jgi:hypothetical protein